MRSLVRNQRGPAPRENDENNYEPVVRPKKRAFRKNPRAKRSYRDRKEVKEPRRARLDTYLAFDANSIKSTDTLRKYRTAFNFLWKVPKARKLLQDAGFKEPGLYEGSNQHAGKVFALPREVPPQSKFGEEQAGFAMRHALKSGATKSQCESVSKLLSYIWQLQTGEAKGNFKKVRQAWKRHPEDAFGAPKQRVKAIYIIEPEHLKVALTTEWTPACPMPYHQWCLAYLGTTFWCVLGARPKIDMGKIKECTDQFIAPHLGYMWFQMKGGRAKIEGSQGTRPWKAYVPCFCPGGKHCGPPETFYETIIDEEQPSWCTSCPISCAQVIQFTLGEEDPRILPALCKSSGKFVKFGGKEYKNIGAKALFPLLQRFLDLMGGNPDGLKFDTNMGRKALGKLFEVVQVPYQIGFEVHGELFENWRAYQEQIENDKNFTRRTQSKSPDVCLKALRRVVRWFGRGETKREDPSHFNMDQVGQLLALIGRNQGLHEAVNRILDG